MARDEIKLKKYLRFFMMGLCLVSLTAASLGCEPLRKKFTRKKKNTEVSQEFIPVLEPVEYAEKSKTPEEKYKHYYSLWKVWERDLMENFDQMNNDKRYKYLLGEMIAQLQEMKKHVKEEKQTELSQMIDGFSRVLGEFDKPQAVRNMPSIKRELEVYSKKIRTSFKPQLMQAYYLGQNQ